MWVLSAQVALEDFRADEAFVGQGGAFGDGLEETKEVGTFCR